jgi:hypothetical protein
VARVVARVVGSLLHLVAFLVDLFFSRSSIFQKNYVAKSLDPFDIKVPESQKHTKIRKTASEC